MAYLVEALARHEVNVAQLLPAARGAYLAAANRAQDTIARFPQLARRTARRSTS